MDADEELLVAIPRAGVIRQMRLRVEPATPEVLGSLRMRIVWDGKGPPSVDVPVGRFFGNMYGGYGKTLRSPAAVLERNSRSTRLRRASSTTRVSTRS